MTGFNDLPNEIVVELWHQVLPPDDIASFARVSRRIFALAAPFLKEYHRLKSKYSVFVNWTSYDGSIFAHLLKDVLLNPHIAFYVKKVCVYDWRSWWVNPAVGTPYSNPDTDDEKNYVWHVPYPEKDMELFRNGIRKAQYVLPSEVDIWIQNLESGDEDPVVTFLLCLLPNLRTLSLGELPFETLLSSTIRRIAENANSTTFSKLKSIQLAGSVFDQHECMSLVKPFMLLPSVEKISCFNFENCRRERDIPDCFIAPQSSNVTELVFDSCGDIVERIPMLLEGIKGLKKFTFVAGCETVDAFWIRSALPNHCRHSLEYLKMRFEYEPSNYLGSLGLFENLRSLDVQHSSLVNPDAGDDFTIGNSLPTSIEAIDMTGQQSETVSHIRSCIMGLVSAKGTRLPNLKRLNYHPVGLLKSKKHFYVDFADMCRLCEGKGFILDFVVS
ncbi:MAG: hypothetical protein ALECFALPRED_001297 [Alectoria fallacina]|uniref:F-box domain-containing protein n=1 Tax=Alectoria fallacina TaxID=1903189 RepID=A0A8H3FA17_9LECA|nr:MAG: hypothetical protein ALECFALPRED_001297 [Alectoria fallacina]